ncbi:hypothetical protein BD414DRAFT_489438 [Trametes punicea]|nr:hypothetical protein BD414DRAFT_489438 [Trametes punicea]
MSSLLDSVFEAMKAVDAAVAKNKTKDKKRITEIASHVSSQFVLFRLQSISESVAQKVSQFLRESLSALYGSVGLPALHLVSSIFRFVYHDRLLPTIGAIERDGQRLWELVLYALLAGVLDFLDAHATKSFKDAIGVALYPSLGEMCFSLTAPMTSVDLRCTAYSILCDSAASHQVNQQKLRDENILGGERLGSCIWRTRDYLALEGLLNVFARALPSTHNSASGRARRTAYIKSVFTTCPPPEAVSSGAQIAEMLENVPTSNWEDTALRIVDVLADAMIAYPQPFIVQEVVACGTSYPSDRLYADEKTFLANVLLGDDQYESLEVAYSTIKCVTLAQTAQNAMRVVLSLSDSPKLGKDFLNPERADGEACPEIAFIFALDNDQLPKLFKTLESRGLSHLITRKSCPLSFPKLSIAATPAKLEFDSAGRPIEELSQEERLENVSQFYNTNEPSDDITSSGDVEETIIGPIDKLVSPLAASVVNASTGGNSELQGPNHQRLQPMNTRHSPSNAYAEGPSGLGCGFGSLSGARNRLNLMHAAAFGLSDEELSEISDCDSPLSDSKAVRRSSTSVSLRRGRISFQPLSMKSIGGSSSATQVARGSLGIDVPDCDDNASVAHASASGQATNAALMREPGVGDSLPDFVLAPAANLPALPQSVAPAVSSPLLGDVTLVSSDVPAKVLRFSDIAAPDFHAPLTSPAVMPRSALKDSLANRTVRSRLAKTAVLDLDTLTSDKQCFLPPRLSPVDAQDPATRASNLLNDLVPPSSSPTPAAKRPVVAKLRRKDENKPVPPESSRAKRKTTPSDNQMEGEELLNDSMRRISKRPRTSASAMAVTMVSADRESAQEKPGIAEERSGYRVLDPRKNAAARATRRYGGRKGGASPPHNAQKGVAPKEDNPVDYDALPNPPPASTATVLVQTSSPASRAKKNLKPKPKIGKTAAKAKSEKASLSPLYQAPAETSQESRSPESGRTTRSTARSRTYTGSKDLMGDPGDVPVIRGPLVKIEKPARLRPQRVLRKRDHSSIILDAESGTAVDRAGALLGVEEHVAELPLGKAEEVMSLCSAANKHVDLPVFDAESASATKEWEEPPQDAGTDGDISVLPIRSGGDSSAEAKISVAPTSAVIPPSELQSPKAHGPQDYASSTLEMGQGKPPILSEHPQRGGISNCNVSAADVARPPREASLVELKKEAERIDLTLDTPPKPPGEQLSVVGEAAELPEMTAGRAFNTSWSQVNEPKVKFVMAEDDEDVTACLGNGRVERDKDSVHRFVAFAAGDHAHATLNGLDLNAEGRSRTTCEYRSASRVPRREFKREATQKLDFEDRHRNNSPMRDILATIECLHEVIVSNLENRFEAVRYEACLGRNELLRNAIADLHTIRAESILHFNKLVDLEAEYATTGRGLIRGIEDLREANEELGRNLTKAVEQHDRTTLAKRMPTNLMAVTL